MGESDPDRAAAALLDLGAELAVVKMGPRGVLARTREQTIHAAPIPVDVVNGLGAGDAFGGALCAQLLDGAPVDEALQLANAAGALITTRPSCAPDMPTRRDLDHFLADHLSNQRLSQQQEAPR